MGDRKPRGRKFNDEMVSSSSSSTSSFSSDEETDVRDLKPIRGYLLNRRELARQLFKSVKSEKIRMMLPQILKNMNLSELEEWCASELYGMSEARILSILNGQPMLNSSDTSETDDSGPSLEIISDTEEWLTDADVAVKEEPSSSGASKSKRPKTAKSKIKNHGQKKNDHDKLRTRGRTAKGNAIVSMECDVKVKKEKENSTSTNKEGESLLDLLELEMRARAIRALIRKEEDVIPSAATEKRMALTTNALRNTLNSAVSASLSSEKSLNGKFDAVESTENNDSKIPSDNSKRSGKSTNEIGDDEDVVFVVAQPTPTIELLSSESDTDSAKQNGKKKNENKSPEEECAQVPTKSGNQRASKTDAIQEMPSNSDTAVKTNERIVTIDKSTDGSDSLKIVITKRISESGSPGPSKSSKTKKSSVDKGDKSFGKTGTVENENTTDKNAIGTASHAGKGLFKKIRRKQHLRRKRKIPEDSNLEQTDKVTSGNASPVGSDADPGKVDAECADVPVIAAAAVVKLEVGEINEQRLDASQLTGREANATKKVTTQRPSMPLDEYEEIIDLDDYPDDMDEIENNYENGKIRKEESSSDTPNQQTLNERKTPLIIDDTIIPTPTDSAETWASRYYQTDDVQNVIKESKIQSEIRKRLRERQRLSKLNSSPKLNSPGGDATTVSDKSEEKVEPKPTGSVQEYLALKNASTTADDGDKIDANVEKRSDLVEGPANETTIPPLISVDPSIANAPLTNNLEEGLAVPPVSIESSSNIVR